MGGEGQILWYGFLTSTESLRELCPHIERLGQRLEDARVLVDVVYVDKCCEYGPMILEV